MSGTTNLNEFVSWVDGYLKGLLVNSHVNSDSLLNFALLECDSCDFVHEYMSFVDEPTFELNIISSGKEYSEVLVDYLSSIVIDEGALNRAVHEIRDMFYFILEEGGFKEFGIFESKINDSKGHSVFFVNENNTLLVLNMLRNAF